jgi:hypothetical protein
VLGVPCLAESVTAKPLTSRKITSLYLRGFFRERPDQSDRRRPKCCAEWFAARPRDR